MGHAKRIIPTVTAVMLGLVVLPAQSAPVGVSGTLNRSATDDAVVQQIHYGYRYYRYYDYYPRYYRYHYYSPRRYRRPSPL